VGRTPVMRAVGSAARSIGSSRRRLPMDHPPRSRRVPERASKSPNPLRASLLRAGITPGGAAGWRPRDIRQAQSMQDSEIFFADLLGGKDTGVGVSSVRADEKCKEDSGPSTKVNEPWLGLRTGQRLEGLVVERNEFGLRVDLGETVGERMVWAQHIVKLGADMQRLDVGDEVVVWVGALKECDNVIQLLLSSPLSAKSLAADKDAVLAKLRAAEGGVLPYGDKIDQNICPRVFGMSKARFKRSIGGLFKAGLIERPEAMQITLATRPGRGEVESSPAPSAIPKEGRQDRGRPRGSNPSHDGVFPRRSGRGPSYRGGSPASRGGRTPGLGERTRRNFGWGQDSSSKSE